MRAASLPGEVLGARDSHSDEEVLLRARAGDAEAFRVIFDREAPGVRRFLGDLLRDDAAADEGTQETFVRAHHRLGTLEQAGKLQGWLFGIARMVSVRLLPLSLASLRTAASVELSLTWNAIIYTQSSGRVYPKV